MKLIKYIVISLLLACFLSGCSSIKNTLTGENKIKTDEFLKSNSFFTDKTISYLMDDMKSLDIDTLNDLEKIKKYIEINNKKRIKN